MSNLFVIKDYAKINGSNKSTQFYLKQAEDGLKKIEELNVRMRLEFSYLRKNIDILNGFIDL